MWSHQPVGNINTDYTDKSTCDTASWFLPLMHWGSNGRFIVTLINGMFPLWFKITCTAFACVILYTLRVFIHYLYIL